MATPVSDIMTTPVLTVDPELSVTAAAAEMVEHGVSRSSARTASSAS